MKISEISIQRPVFAWMLMFALLIFGYMGFQRMGVSQLPDVDAPFVTIRMSLQNASPDTLETDVIDVVEEGLISIEGIKALSSSAQTGSAFISVEFDLDKDVDVAIQEIQNVLSRISRRFPRDLEPAQITKSNPEDQPILWISVSAENLDRGTLMDLVRIQIRDRFATIDGVSEVSLAGFVDRIMAVDLDPRKLRHWDLTPSDIVATIQADHVESPGGRIESSVQELNLRTLGEVASAVDLRNLSIKRRGGSQNYNPMKLGQVAQVEETLDDIRRLSRVDGVAAVGIAIRKQRGSNAVAVADAVISRMKEIQTSLPPGVTIGVRSDSTQFIRASVRELTGHLILAGILTSLVCWLFLGSFTATINVILSIPTSIVGSFIVLSALGFTLNIFTLLALSLAIGIVVDDSIMILENIAKHVERKQPRRTAALMGVREVAFAATAATAAIIAIFLPIAFMEGVIGKYLFQFGVTLSVAVLFSLLEALTLTPMRSSRYLKLEPRTTLIGRSVESAFQRLESSYAALIPRVLNHRWCVVSVCFVVFLATLSTFYFIPKEIVPPEDQSRLLVRIRTGSGAALGYTDEKMREIESALKSLPQIESIFTSVGGFGGNDSNSGTVFVNLKNPKDRIESQQELRFKIQETLKGIKGAKITVQDPSTGLIGGGRTFPIEFSVRGPEWNQLIEEQQKLISSLNAAGFLTDLDSNYREGQPEFQLTPNRDAANQFGVSVQDIASTINILFGGQVVARYSRQGRRSDIRVRMPAELRSSEAILKEVYVRNIRGELIPLNSVVNIKKGTSLQSINRQDRQRAITVTANLAKGTAQQEALARVTTIASETLAAGYYIVPGGSSAAFTETFQSLYFALGLGILVAYMVLGVQFNSFIQPLTILVALPFSISGALAALWLGDKSLNIYSMIGFILLTGIAKKNSILLVDFTNQVRARGENVFQALAEACPKRLRPILMTSIATIVAALPQAISSGAGSESRSAMALAIVGGMFLSTLLTLFLVPAVYSLLSRFESKESDLS